MALPLPAQDPRGDGGGNSEAEQAPSEPWHWTVVWKKKDPGQRKAYDPCPAQHLRFSPPILLRGIRASVRGR